MSFTRKLFVNWLTKKRIGDGIDRMAFLKYEVIPFEIVFLEPQFQGKANEYNRVDITDISLKVAINDTLDDASPLAEQTSWTKNTANMTFSGNLSLNTAGMNSYIDGAKTPYFEIEITDTTGARVKTLSELCAVSQGVLQTTTVSPDPLQTYITLDQAKGLFVPRILAVGETITWQDITGTSRRTIGVNPDFSPQDDVY